MPESSPAKPAKIFIPPFVTRDWIESGVTIGNRALKQIAESREDISRVSGLPDASWPETLDGKPALAALLHRGLSHDPEFVRHCRVAVEGRKQKSPFLFFENAMKRLAMEGRSALGISGNEKMSLTEEIERLLRGDQENIAGQMVFILLAEGYPMFDDDLLPPFLFKDGLAPVHPMLRELRLRRYGREGYSLGESEALADWAEAMNDAIFKLSPRSPSVRSVRTAAGGLRKALAAGAAYESARSQAAPLGDETGGMTEACRRLEKIAPKMGAGELQKRAAQALADLERIAARRFQVNDLRRIKDELTEWRTTLGRACEEMEQADTLLREGGFARRHEADSLLNDGVKRAGEGLGALERTLKFARDAKSGGAGVPAKEIEMETAATIVRMFGGDAARDDAAAAEPAAAEAPAAGGGAGGEAGPEVFDELLVEHVVEGRFAEAAEIARVVKAALHRGLTFSESEINFIRHANALAADAADETARKEYGEAAGEALLDMSEGEEGAATHPPAAGLALFAAALVCARLSGESDAEQVMHQVSVDKEFNDAVWPLKRAIEEGRKTGVFFAGGGDEDGDNAPRVSYKAMRDSVMEAIQDLGGLSFNFSLGQRVVQQLVRKEIGELEEDVRENRIAAMERFAHDHGGHKNADRLIEHAVQRVPSNSEKLDGRARKQLVEAVERVAERCSAYLESSGGSQAETAGGWLRQRRKELLQCVEQSQRAVDDFAVRHAGELAGMAVKRCRQRLEMIKKLAAGNEGA